MEEIEEISQMKLVGNIFHVKDSAVNVKVINQASTTKNKRVQEHKIRIGKVQTALCYVQGFVIKT